jgi:hypothetical protein
MNNLVALMILLNPIRCPSLRKKQLHKSRLWNVLWKLPKIHSFIIVSCSALGVKAGAGIEPAILGAVEALPGPKSSALSRGLRVKRSELRGDVGSPAFRTFDILLLVLRNAHSDGKALVALFAKIFVEGHRGSFQYDAIQWLGESKHTFECAPRRLARNIHVPGQSVHATTCFNAVIRSFTEDVLDQGQLRRINDLVAL